MEPQRSNRKRIVATALATAIEVVEISGMSLDIFHTLLTGSDANAGK
jgi:hypothetical protein